MKSSDTIAAISTPAGRGGIAVVRISGPDALAIVTKHLVFGNGHTALNPRHATYCRFDELDDVVAVYMPKGYTGEPTVELSCHGSTYIQQALLQALVDSGARLAEAGEFTMRAFLNGRLNLSQAEAVADLVDAATPAQHRLAVSQLRGGYAQRLSELRQQLLDLTSLLELELDFSQEDVEFADRRQLQQLLSTLDSQLTTLIDSFAAGNALKRGIAVALVGRPNAGKSSLLNALLQDDRAIVSPVPGTTRDTIEESFNEGGLTFRLVDTAGLRHSDDTIEALGIERSHRAIADAAIVIRVVDPADTTPADIETDKPVITVLNKSDLYPSAGDSVKGAIHLSALTGDGIQTLRKALVDTAHELLPADSDVLLSNVRHRDALLRVEQALAAVRTGLADGIPSDLIATDLRDALYHLGSITGEVSSDDILSNIFSRFCIGK